jgi:hypothetical protein
MIMLKALLNAPQRDTAEDLNTGNTRAALAYAANMTDFKTET